LRWHENPVQEQVYQFGKRTRNGTLFPGQMQEPDIAEHPIGARWVGVTNCDDRIGCDRGWLDQTLNLERQVIRSDRVNRIVFDTLGRRDIGGTPFPAAERESEIAVDDRETVGGLKRSLNDIMRPTRGSGLRSGAVSDLTGIALIGSCSGEPV